MENAISVIVIALAAFLLPVVAGRLRLPAVVLEITFGIVIGHSILNLIPGSEVMDYLAELGFVLLMFLAGFEVDFGRLRRQGVSRIAAGTLVFALTLALSAWFASVLELGPFVTLLLATTSVGLVVPTLRNTRQSTTALGQTILVCALLADFLTLIGATLFAMVHTRGVGWHLLNFPVLFLSMALLLLVLKRLAWWYPEKFDRLFTADDPEEMGIRASLAMMFVFVGLSYLLGVEPILGAFLAGTAFALVFRHRGQLERKLAGFAYGFFIPIFFIHVGIHFDMRALLEPGVFVAALLLLCAAVAVKVLPALALTMWRFTLRESLLAGVLLSARLSLVIAVATLGTRLGLLDPALESQVILLAVV
ncbi:MAG: cation:proton antiporter, partial [Acidobacteriota bacterium]|nr:cation:proton antiporter [Acidobacteriota bacterium]